MTEETLFELAIKTPAAERGALLDRACVGQPELRARVEALLKADVASSPLLKPPQTLDITTGFEATRQYASSEPTPGVVIAGRYTLEQKLGEGGMGEVWVAKQSEPVKRRVALKLIKAGMDSKSVVQRFEQERQALAMMDHPNIAKVLDGGLTQDRRPFFVMELVNGLPLARFCDEAKLSIRERLEIFIPICQAVQHAHQKGIIHRDLKPTNILVTIIDVKATPKVIDFGVAKATSGRLIDESLSTQFGAVVGTLEYMSPEQAGFSGDDIDTRSDIYSLGVILYELLTGLRPIDAKRLKKAALTEMIRIIKEEEPSKPSTRLSTDDSAPSMAALRHTEPKKLSSLLRGELDWVVMKCLEKKRDRRYDTANGLARDIQRYLANETVEARPPSAGYRLRKLVARNKGKVIAAGLVFLVLVAGMIGTTMGLLEARRQEAEAKRQEGIAVTAANEERQAKRREAERAEGEKAAKLDAVNNLNQANKNLAFARKGYEILGSVFAGLDPKANYASLGEFSQTLKNNLKKAVKELDGSILGDPLTVAEMQNTLGVSLLGLGDAQSAVVVHEKALTTRKVHLGEDHPDTLSSMNYLGEAHLANGQVRKAIPLFVLTLEKRQARLGKDHPDTLKSMINVGEAHLADGQVKKAISQLENTLEKCKAKLGNAHSDLLICMSNLAEAYKADGHVKKAIPLLETVMETKKAKLGQDHPDTLTSMHNLATVYKDDLQVRKAIPLLEVLLEKTKVRLGADHRHTIANTNSLASAYHADGQEKRAIPLFEIALEKFKATLRADHPDTLTTMSNLANAYYSEGQMDKAFPLFEAVLDNFKVNLGEDHPKTLTNMNNLANSYRKVGQMGKAIPLLKATMEIRKVKLGENHPDTLASMHNLAFAHYLEGDMQKTIPLLEATLEKRLAILGEDNLDTLTTLQMLGRAFTKDKQWDKAVAKFAQVIPGMRKGIPSGDSRFPRILADTAMDLIQCQRYAIAESQLRESLALREKKNPNHWRCFETRSLLGAALLGLKKYAEAETMLLRGYEGMKQREATILQGELICIPESLDRLIEFYTKTNKPDEVKKWQTEKDKLRKPVEKQ